MRNCSAIFSGCSRAGARRRSDTDVRGGAGDAGDENLGAGIGERRDGVVLGEPVAAVAQLFGEPGERNGFSDRFGGTVSADDGD